MSLCKLFFPKQDKEPESHPGSINDQITDSITQSATYISETDNSLEVNETGYIELEFYPHYPKEKTPSREVAQDTNSFQWTNFAILPGNMD